MSWNLIGPATPRSSDVLPLSDLVIEPGKAAWVVYLDVVCLNYDGGVLDAAVLAAVGALRNCTSPRDEVPSDPHEGGNGLVAERPG